MTIYERIKALRIKKGMSQADLAKKVGYVGRSAISKVENGDRDISQSMIAKYAEALNVTPAYLLYGNDIEPAERYEQYGLMPVKLKRFPLLGEIACGEPLFAGEDRESYVESGTDIHADFCLKAKGDSMINARIRNGDIVFIKSQDTVNNGEIAAVIIDDEATLKRVYYYPDKGKLVLVPENSDYEPLVYVGEELNQIRIIGKAIAFQSDVK